MAEPSLRSVEEERPVEPSRAEPVEPGRAQRVSAAIVLGLFALGIGSAIGAAAFLASMVGEEAPPEVITVRPASDVVAAVRDLARLETTTFHMERVIELTSTQSRLFGLVAAEDAILLVAAADVVAGIDLSLLGDGDVEVDATRESVRIVLPPPRILSTHLDNDRTYVHSRRTDLLATRGNALETRARREAERTLERSALEAGILARAEASAIQTISALLRSLGFVHVDVQIQRRL